MNHSIRCQTRFYSVHLPVACLAIGLFCTARSLRAEEAPAEPAKRSVEASLAADPLVRKVLNAALVMQRQSWEQGVLAQYFVEAGDQEMIVTTGRAMLIHTNKNGTVAAVGGSTVDPLMGGEALFRAAQISQDPMLVAAQEKMLAFARTGAGRTKDGIVCHNGKNTIWGDTANTAAPYLAVTGNQADAAEQIKGIYRKLWDPKRKLLAHIWDEDQKRWSDPSALGRRQRLVLCRHDAGHPCLATRNAKRESGTGGHLGNGPRRRDRSPAGGRSISQHARQARLLC